MIIKPPSRRGLILGGAAAASLAGCDQLQQNSGVTDFIRVGENCIFFSLIFGRKIQTFNLNFRCGTAAEKIAD